MIERLSQLAGKHGAFLCQASGYLAVSVVALGVDLAFYWLLLGSFDSAIAPAAIGYTFGLVVHYALASRLVFSRAASGRGLAAEAPTFAKYAATGIAGCRDDIGHRRAVRGRVGLEPARGEGAGDAGRVRGRVPGAAVRGVRPAGRGCVGGVIAKCRRSGQAPAFAGDSARPDNPWCAGDVGSRASGP